MNEDNRCRARGVCPFDLRCLVRSDGGFGGHLPLLVSADDSAIRATPPLINCNNSSRNVMTRSELGIISLRCDRNSMLPARTMSPLLQEFVERTRGLCAVW